MHLRFSLFISHFIASFVFLISKFTYLYHCWYIFMIFWMMSNYCCIFHFRNCYHYENSFKIFEFEFSIAFNDTCYCQDKFYIFIYHFIWIYFVYILTFHEDYIEIFYFNYRLYYYFVNFDWFCELFLMKWMSIYFDDSNCFSRLFLYITLWMFLLLLSFFL